VKLIHAVLATAGLAALIAIMIVVSVAAWPLGVVLLVGTAVWLVFRFAVPQGERKQLNARWSSTKLGKPATASQRGYATVIGFISGGFLVARHDSGARICGVTIVLFAAAGWIRWVGLPIWRRRRAA
jgi:hypothetical protein